VGVVPILVAVGFAVLVVGGVVSVLSAPRRPEPSASTPPTVPAETPAYKQNITDEASAKYEPMIAAAWLQIPQDEKLIADQKEVVVAQTSPVRRAAEQQKLKELEEKLEKDRKTIDRLVREEQEERDRRVAEAQRQREAARAVQAEAERQRKEQPRLIEYKSYTKKEGGGYTLFVLVSRMATRQQVLDLGEYLQRENANYVTSLDIYDDETLWRDPDGERFDHLRGAEWEAAVRKGEEALKKHWLAGFDESTGGKVKWLAETRDH
jgi:hypothetical protein